MSYFPAILYDPQLAISKRDKNLILKSASSAWFKKPLNLIIYMAAMITWAVFMASTRTLLNNFVPDTTIYTVMLWVVFFPLFLVGCHYLIFHVGFRPYLYRELRNRGHDICVKCGYILIDIPESNPKCPECGTPRSPLPSKPIAE